MTKHGFRPSLILTLLIASGTLTACGGGAGAKTVLTPAPAPVPNNTTNSSAPAPAPTPAPAPAPAPAPTPAPAPAPTPAPAPAPTPAPAPAPAPAAANPNARYISPTGSDTSNSCAVQATPCKTFAYTFARTPAGGEVILADGTYDPSTTGVMHWDTSAYTTRSAQIPSGTSKTANTYVHAKNPGKVVINGEWFVGRSATKHQYITVSGVKFEGGVSLYNTNNVTLSDSGVHGSLDVGTNDHDNGNTYNLIQDVWVWASGKRIIAINYRAHNSVWRRVVVRGDGCGVAACQGSGNPNVGFTVYDSHDVSIQNVMVVDRVLLANDSSYSDFAIASHTGGQYSFGRNEWLGTISANSPDSGYYMEPDVGTALDKTIKISNAVAWNSTDEGFNIARSGTNIVVQNILAKARSGEGFRFAPELSDSTNTNALSNLLILGSGTYGLNASVSASYVNVTGTWSGGLYNQTTPTNTVAGAPLTGNNLKHVTRVEAGSYLKGKGLGGADVGPSIIYRYGVDGSRHGDTNYNALSTTALWPWPNQDRMKTDMCANTTRGFCSTGKALDGVSSVTFTSYIWELMGNRMPSTF